MTKIPVGDLRTAYQMCTCGDVCQGCTICNSVTYERQPCVKQQWLQLDSIKIPVHRGPPREPTFEEKVDRFLAKLEEDGFPLLPWQSKMLRDCLIRGAELL